MGGGCGGVLAFRMKTALMQAVTGWVGQYRRRRRRPQITP